MQLAPEIPRQSPKPKIHSAADKWELACLTKVPLRTWKPPYPKKEYQSMQCLNKSRNAEPPSTQIYILSLRCLKFNLEPNDKYTCINCSHIFDSGDWLRWKAFKNLLRGDYLLP